MVTGSLTTVRDSGGNRCLAFPPPPVPAPSVPAPSGPGLTLPEPSRIRGAGTREASGGPLPGLAGRRPRNRSRRDRRSARSTGRYRGGAPNRFHPKEQTLLNWSIEGRPRPEGPRESSLRGASRRPPTPPAALQAAKCRLGIMRTSDAIRETSGAKYDRLVRRSTLWRNQTCD